ncbi:MAG: ATP-binding protein, partial [Chloroflexota bacterium]
EAGLKFAIAHCHFGLRGKQADADENFVRNLATVYEVPFYTKRFFTKAYAQKHKVSIQMAARDLRYTWFTTLPRTFCNDPISSIHSSVNI